ncbi:MAG TPA: hypothetical protein VFL51_01440 [Pseudolabrys sp.]|nr:hypothetical protein [Pseudolabrys sp.]
MRKFGLAIALATALGGAAMTSAAQAAPAAPGIGDAAAGLGLVEQTQFVIGGRNYCWYDGGWHGPGWYWCGYAWRRGFGWGGPRGWHGWVWRGWHGPRRVYHHRPHYEHHRHHR